MCWGAVAGFAGLVACCWTRQRGRPRRPVAVGGGGAALALGLYLLERRVLQQVALFLALAATMVAAGDRLVVVETADGYGLLVLGAGWLELGRRGLVAPRRTSETLGSLALLAGPEALDAAGAGPGDWGLWLGLGLAVALVVAGSVLRRNVPLGIGAAGMVVFLGQVAGEHWRDLGASGHPAGRAGAGRGRGGAGPAAARRPGRAAASGSRTAVRALTMPWP